ncbi:MAG: phage tail fiber protein [Dehalococcoidales bacterium]
MTVNTESGRSPNYAGTGSQTTFPITFEFKDETHLEVIVTVDATGVETVQVLTTDYTVVGTDVEMVTAPISGETLVILRNVPFTQLSDYSNTGGADQEVTETDLDLATMRDLQVDEIQDRSLTVPKTSSLSGSQLEVPDPALTANRGQVLATKADGTGIELVTNVPVGTTPAAIGAGDAGKLIVANATEDGIAAADDGTDISENLTFSGTLSLGTVAERTVDAGVTIDGALIKDGYAPLTTNFLTGLILSNNATAYRVNVAAGICRDDGDAANLILAASISKDATGSWVVGTNQGGLDGTESVPGTPDADTWYHIWLIRRSDTGVVDVLFSESATAPTMPTNYDQRRRIGAVLTNGTPNDVLDFRQDGDLFQWDIPVEDYDAIPNSAAAVLVTLSIPLGVKIQARLTVAQVDPSPAGREHLLVSDPDITDTAASGNVKTLATNVGADETVIGITVMTNTSGQIRFRCENVLADLVVQIQVNAWIDFRGRDS